MIDFVKDMEFCQQLDINIKNKPRTHIKAEILSKMTGEPINTMSNFFSSNSRKAIQEAIKKLNDLGGFLKTYNQNLTIQESGRKSPSFFLSKKKQPIGLELVDVHSNSIIKVKDDSIEGILKEIEETENSFTGVYNFYFKKSPQSPEEKQIFKGEVLQYLTDSTIGNQFIDKVIIEPTDALYLNNNTIFPTGNLTLNEIIEKTSEVEKDLLTYNTSNNDTEY
jgi:hypothetical protein